MKKLWWKFTKMSVCNLWKAKLLQHLCKTSEARTFCLVKNKNSFDLQRIHGRVYIYKKFHTFRIFFLIPLDVCVWSMRIIILDIQATFTQQKPYCKNFWWIYIKNARCKPYLGNKEEKKLFLTVSSTLSLILRALFFYVPDRDCK